MSETKKIAILIDCWGEDYLTYPLERQILYKTIDTFLQSGIVDKIIMATYDTGEAIQPKLYNPWIDYTKAYMKQNELSWHKKVERDKMQLGENLTKNLDHYVRHTNKGFVTRWKDWNTPVLFLHYPWEISSIDSIEEVFIFGFDWQICVESRPLGYDFWLKKTKANVYFDPLGVEYKNKNNDKWYGKYSISKTYPNLRSLREQPLNSLNQ